MDIHKSLSIYIYIKLQTPITIYNPYTYKYMSLLLPTIGAHHGPQSRRSEWKRSESDASTTGCVKLFCGCFIVVCLVKSHVFSPRPGGCPCVFSPFLHFYRNKCNNWNQEGKTHPTKTAKNRQQDEEDKQHHAASTQLFFSQLDRRNMTSPSYI